MCVYVCICENLSEYFHVCKVEKETYYLIDNLKSKFISVCVLEVICYEKHIHNLSTVSFAKIHPRDNKLYFTLDILLHACHIYFVYIRCTLYDSCT
jgi:hypothetical protein